MGLVAVKEVLKVPGNASRLFATAKDSIKQPRGVVQLGWDSSDPYVRNVRYNPNIIRFDGAYCTSVTDINGVPAIPTLSYFYDEVEPHIPAEAHVTDLGCGQGEFVHELRAHGTNAIGFDPVVRNPDEHLFKKLWDATDAPQTDLVVMRCVLPHISEPWEFLKAIGAHQQNALVLIEFQRLEWIIDHGCWYQFCHDHVNQFSDSDFARRFTVITSGIFGNGEWGWVLIDPKSYIRCDSLPFEHLESIEELLVKRRIWLETIRKSVVSRIIWGAAAKGTVLADAMNQDDSPPTLIADTDPNKWDKYLEGSGAKVVAPQEFIGDLGSNHHILVANPNHLEAVSRYLASTSVTIGSATPDESRRTI